MNRSIYQKFEVAWKYPVFFTEDVFHEENRIFLEAITLQEREKKYRLLFVIDDGVAKAHPYLEKQILQYVSCHGNSLALSAPLLVVPGGEIAKNSHHLIENLQIQIHKHGLCRQSFVIAIGGGAVLDMAGFACSTPHRGIRLIRIPTTVLSQNDSGVGVKNAINAFGKKNFLGTFSPPFAVINDRKFLTTLRQRDWLAGVAEAVKVALLKDKNFFLYLEKNTQSLVKRDIAVLQETIYQCARLHLEHIRTSGDPFEYGSSRPLDFGHWAAHKLESLSDYRLRHGEAVASGIALDTCYSVIQGFLQQEEGNKILTLLKELQFHLYQPEMENESFWNGLAEFREHLGGILCIPLLRSIAHPIEVNEMDTTKIKKAIFFLKEQNL